MGMKKRWGAPKPWNSVSLAALALDVCLDMDHPLYERFPELEQCPDMDAVYEALLRFFLAEGA